MKLFGDSPKVTVKQLLIGKTASTHVQFLRYAVVAVISLIVDAGMLAISKNVLNLNNVAAATVGFTLGLVVNYLLSVLWVFPASSFKNKWHEIVIFGLIGLVGLILTDLFVWLLTKHTGLVVSKAVAVIIVYFWNFFARKKILYSSPLVETTL